MDIAVLGPVQLWTDAGAPATVTGARLRTLLVLLALAPGQVVSTQRLADGIWGDDQPAAVGNALQALVSRLRRAGCVIETVATGYRLAIDPDRVDAVRFERLARDPATVGEALALWRGPLEFPDAAHADAARLTELRLAAQLSRIAADLDAGGHDLVLPELEELVAGHPLDERAAALLMRALLAGDSPARALAAFERIRAELAETLGADPSSELTALHLQALRGTPQRGNLPAEVSSFVGREVDVRTVRELLSANRLVTLTGPGGSGKTRLSVEAAAGVRVRDGVWRVELAPVTEPAEVLVAILTALRMRGQLSLTGPGTTPPGESADPLTRLCDTVAGREMLMVLDNCEHLIDTAARVADRLLRAAPHLRLLATSREPLAIAGERCYAVEPLPLPPVDADVSTAAGFASVRLLLDRAPSCRLTRENVASVSNVVRALDGMPLAIELAAARLRTVALDVLESRLTDRFALLTGGSRTALPRHQTLRAVVDWSWDLLSERERRLWRGFALFHGGADLPAAEQVCDADIDLLGALVDKSLLVLGADGRYRMLETIREYGLDRLAEAGERETARERLASYLVGLARTAEPHLRGADQLGWLRRLGNDHDNFHAALRDAIDAGDKATAVALTAALGWYWWLRGHRLEGAAMCRQVLALVGEADPAELALTYGSHALNGLEGAAPLAEVKQSFAQAVRLSAGHEQRHPVLRLLPALGSIFGTGGPAVSLAACASLFDDPDLWLRAVARLVAAQLRLNFGYPAAEAEADMRAALENFRAVGERWGMGFTLSSLGDLSAARGEFSTAVTWQYEALALVREVGVREDLPQLETKLAHQLWLAGDRAGARRMLQQASESAQDIGLGEVMASVEYGYATIARAEGQLVQARRRMTRALELIERSEYAPQFTAVIRSTQGLIDAATGDYEGATKHHAEAVRVAVDSKDSPVVALVLVGVADLALRQGDPARAARLLGASDAIRGSHDRSVPDIERVTAEARTALGDAGFTAAYAEGGAVTVATALAATGLTPVV